MFEIYYIKLSAVTNVGFSVIRMNIDIQHQGRNKLYKSNYMPNIIRHVFARFITGEK